MLKLPQLRPNTKEVFKKTMDMFQYWSNYSNIVKARVINQVFKELEKTTLHLQTASLQVYDMVNEIAKLYKSLTTMLDQEVQAKMIDEAFEFGDSVLSRITSDEEIKLDDDPANRDCSGEIAVFLSKSLTGLQPNRDCRAEVADCVSTFLTDLQAEIQFKYIDEFKMNFKFYQGIQNPKIDI